MSISPGFTAAQMELARAWMEDGLPTTAVIKQLKLADGKTHYPTVYSFVARAYRQLTAELMEGASENADGAVTSAAESL